MQSISEWQNLLLAPSYELPTPMRCIAPMEVVYGWQQDNFISRLSNLKISCPPPAEAVHAAAIPFTEILRGFSSWNPDTSGDARNEKSVMLFHASVMALRMIFAAPLQSALRQSSGCSVNPCRSPVSSVCFRQEQVYRRDVPCSSL